MSFLFPESDRNRKTTKNAHIRSAAAEFQPISGAIKPSGTKTRRKFNLAGQGLGRRAVPIDLMECLSELATGSKSTKSWIYLGVNEASFDF